MTKMIDEFDKWLLAQECVPEKGGIAGGDCVFPAVSGESAGGLNRALADELRVHDRGRVSGGGAGEVCDSSGGVRFQRASAALRGRGGGGGPACVLDGGWGDCG